MNRFETYLKNHPLTTLYATQSGVFAHVTITQEALLLIGSFALDQKKRTVIKESQVQAEQLKRRIEMLASDIRVIGYYHEESLRVEALMQSDTMRTMRIDALLRIMAQDYDIVVTHAKAIIRKMTSEHELRAMMDTYTLDMEIDPKDLVQSLIQKGYTKVKYVEKPFTFATRGGIVDVYPITYEHPVRIEFFDVIIDSIRMFSSEDQRSVKVLDTVSIPFANDLFIKAQEIEHVKAALLASKPNELLTHHMEMMIDGLTQQDISPMLVGYIDSDTTILNFLSQSILIQSPQEGVARSIEQFQMDTFQYLEELTDNQELIQVPHPYLVPQISAYELFEYEHPHEQYIPWHDVDIVSHDVFRFISQEIKVKPIVIQVGQEHIDYVMKSCIEHQLHYEVLDADMLPSAPGLYVSNNDLKEGYVIEDVMVLSAHDLGLNRTQHFRYDTKYAKAEVLTQLSDLSKKDYVVHRQYGIGRYEGIETKMIEGRNKDFMRIVYRDNDELFVPLEQFSLVRKYLSSEAAAVTLSKLGSSAWQKNKDRVKASVADIADRLVALYSSRLETSGFAFSPDTDYQKAFEAAFPYPLTKDQAIAIQDIKKDMESPRPMDRLLIGDVGFGKTEVAIRAAFKAVTDQKQIAFLCPTTILSAQHGRTFKERFKDYPVRIEILNRFVSPAKQAAIMKDVEKGLVDILIGTHRILSKDIKFKDLGLLIIDEEQRFGVTHKERIKEFKVSVDVLSLSATPIPRTLQMSLIGIRQLSQLNTPPMNRLPVMTYVVEYNKQTLYDLIRKELSRDGQAYYLYNHTEMIYSVANDIAKSIPEAKVGIIHGKMDRVEIEDVMLAFIAKEYNVLVCTTIIETGIDIPNANTIIVENAHRFGLSQLYQIKGRVGRSDRLAYAYFVVPEKRRLTEIASKRLQAIKEFTQLGSGYKIAMRDLTIRGAGELLGGNQSGFIDTVGMELYVELLKEAIAERQGVAQETKASRAVIQAEGYLPEQFTQDDGETLELYQKINDIENLEMLKQFTVMLEDRYGKLPQEVALLLEKVRLELLLSDPRIESFKERMHAFDVVFALDFSQKVDGVALFETVSHLSTEIQLKYQDRKIALKIPYYTGWEQDLLVILTSIKERDDEN